MSSPLNTALALLLTSLLALLCGESFVLAQDLRETDALCTEDGCLVVYFQRKTFLDSWKACKKKGGTLATIKHQRDESTIASLFSSLDLRHSRSKVQVWIGLQRQPRQCTSSRPLRGFSWTTGDQDTEYTNWLKEDLPSTCSVSRCVAMGYNTEDHKENFKWLDGACSVSVDGYLCHYAFEGMCTTLWSEGAGNAVYSTPFSLFSTLLTHIPSGSVATLPCPEGSEDKQSVQCTLKDDGSVGWSRDPPLCYNPPVTQNWCEQGNSGCEHYCKPTGVHFYCECADGYQLRDDKRTCELTVACQGTPCKTECLPTMDRYGCVCPEGFMQTPDEQSCVDVDECLQSPCEQLCVNAPGSFVCQCWDGYTLDDTGSCEDADECLNEPCEHACENTAGSHICHCRLGYSPLLEDPSRCQDDDECLIPGTCEQMCVNYVGGFECYCVEGYKLRADHYSCQKRAKEDEQSAVTPPFPWGTHQPMWDPEYDWSPQQSNTVWPLEEDLSLDWLTDPPQVQDSNVIWVTSSPFDLPPDPPAEEEEENLDTGAAYLLEWGQRSVSELEVVSTTIHPTPPTTESPSNAKWYEEGEEEETTTAPPLLSTSTISGGAWNWWAGITTPSLEPGNLDDPVRDLDMPTDSSNHSMEDQNALRENTELPEEELGEEAEEITRSQNPAVPTQLNPSQPPTSESGGSRTVVDAEEAGQKKQSRIRLLVGLLVPLCLFIVVTVALGIMYCTRCAVQQQNKNATDCYHWISGAHDKQGASPPSEGVKTPV